MGVSQHPQPAPERYRCGKTCCHRNLLNPPHDRKETPCLFTPTLPSRICQADLTPPAAACDPALRGSRCAHDFDNLRATRKTPFLREIAFPDLQEENGRALL